LSRLRRAIHRLSAPKAALLCVTAFVVVGAGSQLLGADPPAPFAWGLGAGYAVVVVFRGAHLWADRASGTRSPLALVSWILLTAGLTCFFLATQGGRPEGVIRHVLLVFGGVAWMASTFLPVRREKKQGFAQQETVV
jgi:hypothetical protein